MGLNRNGPVERARLPGASSDTVWKELQVVKDDLAEAEDDREIAKRLHAVSRLRIGSWGRGGGW